DRRPRHLRLSTKWAMRPICIFCQSATQEISLHIGQDTGNIRPKEDRQSYRRCSGFKLLEQRQFFTIASSKNRRRWRPQFELEIQQAGNKRARPSPSRMERLTW